MSCWKDPKNRRACIIDAVAIAIISSFAGGFFGLMIGLYICNV